MATGRPVGRPPKPVAVKRANGNPGQRKLPTAPMPGEGIASNGLAPKAPVLNDDGMALWSHLWSVGKGFLSPERDYMTVRMLCEAHDEHEAIRKALASNEVPRFYVTANGQIVTHPMVTQLSALRTQMTSWFSALGGFTPADRARLGLAEVRVNDELDELERRRATRIA